MPNSILKASTSVSILTLISILFFSACSEKDEEDSPRASSTIKCGAGKCGANMFEGNSALMKKKDNILSQMDPKDLRKDCVRGAKTTKALYDCVRDTRTGKLIKTDRYVNEHENTDSSKKCGAEKCGAKM